MSIEQQPRLYNQRNIKLRSLFKINESVGLVIPKTFVNRMKLAVGQFVKCELDKEGRSFSVEGAENIWSD